MAGSPGMIGWKGARLQIATELLAGMIVNAGTYPLCEGTLRTALEQAEALLLENEKMP